MKKFLALALVFVILCFMGNSCDGDSSNKDETPKTETSAEDSKNPAEEEKKPELEDTTKEEQKPEDNEDLTDEPPIDF